jgi:hypothetical protein
MKKITYVILVLALSLTALKATFAQSMTDVLKEKGFSVLEENDATILFQKDYHYVFGVNLQQMEVQSFQKIDSTKEIGQGNFLGTISSPYFHQIDFNDIITENEDAYIINSSYFESYELSTQLSYPIFTNGAWITSGSSRYGPTTNPIDEFYGSIDLLALTINDEDAKIGIFNKDMAASGIVLVSQNYSDHPAKVLANNRKTRFLLVTTLDENKDGKDEWLLFSTGYVGTIDDQANVLKLVNNKRPIMTLDGGSSVFFYHPTRGVLSPVINKIKTSIEGEEKENMLPHYLIFKRK